MRSQIQFKNFSFNIIKFLFALTLFTLGNAAYAERISGVGVEGTNFSIRLDNGRILDSAALIGAELDVVMPDGSSQHVKIADVQSDDGDHEVFLHRMLVADAQGQWSELCEADAAGHNWSFPLAGQWNSEGERVSDSGFTLTCASDAIGKCVRFGYKPWKTVDGTALSDYHAACVKAVRADYCGDRATTRNGQLIDIYDAMGIQHREQSSDALRFEAAFSPSGALCVAHTRVPQRMTLDALGASCPRLAGRIGADACIESEATAGHYGSALIFIRSPEGDRVSVPSRGEMPVEGPTGAAGGSNIPTGEH